MSGGSNKDKETNTKVVTAEDDDDEEKAGEPTAKILQALKASKLALSKNSEHLLRVTLPLIIENRNPLSRFRAFLD